MLRAADLIRLLRAEVECYEQTIRAMEAELETARNRRRLELRFRRRMLKAALTRLQSRLRSALSSSTITVPFH